MNRETGAISPTCPKCKAVIPSDDVNVANDVAFCRGCNALFKLSSLTSGAALEANLDINRPPAGAWYRSEGIEVVIGATHRALGTAIGALAISLFWNGIVSIFVLLAIAGTLRNLHVPLPDWFPVPNMNGNPMSVGMTIFLWLFLTPFIVVGLAMIGAFLSSLAGRTEVRISNSEGVVFTGIGPLGLRRRFVPSSVVDVRINDQAWRDNNGTTQRKTCIILETREGKQVKFGTMLKEERRRFVAGGVRRALRITG